MNKWSVEICEDFFGVETVRPLSTDELVNDYGLTLTKMRDAFLQSLDFDEQIDVFSTLELLCSYFEDVLDLEERILLDKEVETSIYSGKLFVGMFSEIEDLVNTFFHFLRDEMHFSKKHLLEMQRLYCYDI